MIIKDLQVLSTIEHERLRASCPRSAVPALQPKKLIMKVVRRDLYGIEASLLEMLGGGAGQEHRAALLWNATPSFQLLARDGVRRDADVFESGATGVAHPSAGLLHNGFRNQLEQGGQGFNTAAEQLGRKMLGPGFVEWAGWPLNVENGLNDLERLGMFRAPWASKTMVKW